MRVRCGGCLERFDFSIFQFIYESILFLHKRNSIARFIRISPTIIAVATFLHSIFMCTFANVLIYLCICLFKCFFSLLFRYQFLSALESIRFDCIHVCHDSIDTSLDSLLLLLNSRLNYFCIEHLMLCARFILCKRDISHLSNCFVIFFYRSSDISRAMFCIIMAFFPFDL